MNCETCKEDVDTLFDSQCPLCWATDEDNRDVEGNDALEALDMLFDVVSQLKAARDEARATAAGWRACVGRLSESLREISWHSAVADRDPGLSEMPWKLPWERLEDIPKVHGKSEVERARKIAERLRDKYEPAQRLAWEDGI